jgi:hypothetical protein
MRSYLVLCCMQLEVVKLLKSGSCMKLEVAKLLKSANSQKPKEGKLLSVGSRGMREPLKQKGLWGQSTSGLKQRKRPSMKPETRKLLK